MKKLLLGSVIFFAIAGCSKQLDYRNTELSNGMFYKKGANTPFTGKVTNVPLNILPTKNLSDMLQYASQFSEDSSLGNLFTATAIASFLGQNANSAVLCDTNIEDGYLDGEAICATASGKYKVADIEYAAGTIEGAVTLYSLKDKSGSTLASASFAAGKLHGNFKIYGLKTNKVVSETNWKNDALDGESKGYSKDNGNLIQQGMIASNKRDGEWKFYDPDTGKLAKTVMYKDGDMIESQAQTPASNELASFKAKITSALSTPTSQPDQASPPATSTTSNNQAVKTTQSKGYDAWCNPQSDDDCSIDNKKVPKRDLPKYIPAKDCDNTPGLMGAPGDPFCYDDKGNVMATSASYFRK